MSSSSSSTTTTDSTSHSQNLTTPILTSSTHLQIKLTKDNYLSWKTAITPYINGNKILHHIDGTTAAPPKHIPSPTTPSVLIPNPTYNTWFETDQLLLSVLVSTISESLVSTLVGLSSSLEVWITLEKMFSSQSRARVMQTRYHLATLKKGNSTISEYFHKAKTYSDLLASIGQPLSNNDIVTYLLADLPSDYDSLIVTVTMRLEDFPLDDLYGHLLTHELQLEQQATVPDLGLSTANLATKPSSPNQPHHPFTNFHGCGNNGSYSNNGSSSNTSSSRSFCQICLKVGHLAPTC